VHPLGRESPPRLRKLVRYSVCFIVSACVLRATTKKVINFFGEGKCTPDKILATPMVVRILLLK